MLSQDDTTYTSTGATERISRHVSRQEILQEKRMRNTDYLPEVSGEASSGRMSVRQITYLRDENRRLHKELEILQRRLAEHRQTEAQLEKELETANSTRQAEIEQYQSNIRDMMSELNQKQEALADLERRYQDLYHSFHEAVEEEANKMVKEAAQTLVLSPEHTPPILHDVMKTLEFQVKQTEDKHVAEVMALMRQAQRKAELLEQELAREREKVAQDHQNILALQNSIRQQAQLRYKLIETRLRSRFTMAVTLLTTVLLLVLPVIQSTFFYLKLPTFWALFAPVLICMVIAMICARFWSHTAYHKPPRPKAKDEKKPSDKGKK
jgi:hypothetical protein